MKEKLSPQKEIIVSILRDLNWHCGREWLNRIKDDRKRISELNETYMASKGYEIVGEACKGRFCGVKDCPLFARRAQKIEIVDEVESDTWKKHAAKLCELFDAGKSSQEIFSLA